MMVDLFPYSNTEIDPPSWDCRDWRTSGSRYQAKVRAAVD
jgi:hypothetical protein